MFAKGYIVFLFYVSGNISFWGKWLKSHINGTFAPNFPKNKTRFWQLLLILGNIFGKEIHMRKKNFKGRCEKITVTKSKSICKTYDNLQRSYLEKLEANSDIQEIRMNIVLDSLPDYMSDFVCVKNDGGLMVRECVYRKFLTKPMTVKLLDDSRNYWRNHGVEDWGLVIDAE